MYHLHKIPISGISDWSSNAEEDFAELNLDQAAIGSTGDTYANGTSVAEGATHRQTFIPLKSPQEAIRVNVGAKGSGNWTLKVHDSSNVEVATLTITNGNMASSGFQLFEFASVWYPVLGDTYHVHIYDSVGDGTVVSTTNNDLEDGNMKIYTTSDSEFHPMLDKNGVLFIGDRHLLHQVSAIGTSDKNHIFTLDALDMNEPYRVKSLGEYGNDILIGTGISDTVNKARMYRWNTFATSFSTSDDVPAPWINAFLPGDNYTLVNVGLSGRFYIYNGEVLELHKVLPGEYSPTAQGYVHPNSSANLGESLILCGFSQHTGNPTEFGVYVLGRRDNKYPIIFDLSFPISERSGGSLVLSDIQIGAILTIGNNGVVAWKKGSTYGFDKIDYSNKLNGAYFETRVEIVEREIEQTMPQVFVAYNLMPSGCSLAIGHKANYAASFTDTGAKKDTKRRIYYADKNVLFTTIQLQVTATVSSNDAPTVESAGFLYGD